MAGFPFWPWPPSKIPFHQSRLPQAAAAAVGNGDGAAAVAADGGGFFVVVISPAKFPQQVPQAGRGRHGSPWPIGDTPCP